MGKATWIAIVAVAAIVVIAVAAYLAGSQAPRQATGTFTVTVTTVTTAAVTSPSPTAGKYAWKVVGVYVAAGDNIVSGAPPAQSPPAGFLTPNLVNVTSTGGGEVVEIGVIQPLTGTLGSLGELAAAAAQLAAEDVNAYLASINARFRVRVVVADTQGNPTVALQQLQSLAARGVKFYIGRTSGEMRAIKQYADQNRLIVISASSTAVSLAIPNDYIFRLAPPDNRQVVALSKLLQSSGIKAVVVIHRNDDWGRGLAAGLRNETGRRGMDYLAAISYDPQKGEFSTEVSLLAQNVRDAVSRYGADRVAVVAFGFNELQTIFLAAKNYPELGQVRWFGADGSVGLSELLAPAVADFAVKVGGFQSTKFGVSRSVYYDRVRRYILSKYGREPDAYAYNAYDAVWLLAYSMLQAGSTDSEKVYAALPQVAARYFGASGWTKLDANGDRDTADYEIWAIAPS